MGVHLKVLLITTH